MATLESPPRARTSFTSPWWPGARRPSRQLGQSRWWLVSGCGAAAAGVVLRFVCRSPLWLDEAQTVAIVRRPLAQLPGALRHDGAPPLYYALLHLWVRVVGTGTAAVRTLSALFSVLTLPVIWAVGRRLGGRRAAVAATLLMACSPFGIFFATETRMYALSILLSLLGLLALLRTLERATWTNAASLSAVTTALLLTHYWNGFVVAAGAVVVAVAAVRRALDRRTAAIAVGALGIGAALFLPWVPVLLFQLRHTGAPWAAPPTMITVGHAFADWSAPAQTVVFRGLPAASYAAAIGLAVVWVLLLFAAVLRTRWLRRTHAASAAGLLAAAAMALALAVVMSRFAGGGYEPRYTAAVFALVIGGAGLGVARLPGRVGPAVLAVVCVVGLASTALAASVPAKTQAGMIANTIRTRAHSGDVVVYCPDQLAPAVSRLLPDSLTQLAFPTGADVATVDWVDYAKRNGRASPADFAMQVERAAPRSVIWLVDVPHGYATFGNKCRDLRALLARGRRSTLLMRALPHSYYEFGNLTVMTPESTR